MASVYKCTGCKKFFPKEDVYKSSGMQNFHSEECLKVYQGRKPASNGGRESSHPKRRKSDIPADVRAAVLKRDGLRCRWCGTRSHLHLHHIIYRSGGGKHTAENLITLCQRHHDAVHSDKETYQPACQGVVWLYYYAGRLITVPEYIRWMARMEADES